MLYTVRGAVHRSATTIEAATSRFAVIATPSILRPVAGKYNEKLTDDRNEPREAPGMGHALLVVLLMLGITAVLCILVYGVMIAIRPIEARQYKKAADVEQLSPHLRIIHLDATPGKV